MRFLLALLLCWPLAAQVFPSPGPGGAPVGGAALTSGSYNGTSSLMTVATAASAGFGVSVMAHVETGGVGASRDIFTITDSAGTGRLSMQQISNNDFRCLATGTSTPSTPARTSVFTTNGVKHVLGCAWVSATDRRLYYGGTETTSSGDSGAVPTLNTTTVGARVLTSTTSFWSGKVRKVCIKVSATIYTLGEFQAFEADPETCPAGTTHQYTGHTGVDEIGTLDLTPTAVTEVAW